ncbi:hypothetical protein ABFS83_07G069200 [Erythranthe nasuta]
MARFNILAVIVAMFVVMAAFISPAVGNKFIGYPAMWSDPVNWRTPPGAANPYRRGCEAAEQCREEA